MKVLLLILLFIMCVNISTAQEIEPRNYANIPKGVTVAALSYSLSNGSVVSDATAAIQGLKITSNTLVLTGLRSFALFNKLCRVSLNVPYTFLSGSAKLNGKDTSATRDGFADTRIKFGINLFGAPPLSPKEFVKYNEETVLGTSVVVSIPTGQYLEEKPINIGSNRWGIKPEIGVSRKFGPLYFEIYSGVWFFTKNNEYIITNTLEQENIFSFQGHMSYIFPSKIWIALNGAYADGGETSVNGIVRNDFQKNWRFGGTLSLPLTVNHSFKAMLNTGAVTRAGQDFTLFTFAYQYTWF